MNHSKALAVFLGIFVVMPVLVFFVLRWLARRWLSTPSTSEVAAEIKGFQFFWQIPSVARTYVAVAICMVSAVWGAVAIQRGWGSVSGVSFNVACPWLLSGSWLSGEFTREGLNRLNKSMGVIYKDAQQKKLPIAPPLARVMNAGGGIMIVAGIVGWFV